MTKKIVCTLFLLFSTVCFATYGSPFEIIGENLNVVAGENFTANIHIKIPKNYFLYAEDLSIDFKSLEGIQIKKIDIPEPRPWLDPKFNKIRMVFDEDINIKISCLAPIDLEPGDLDIVAVVEFKGCTPKECLMAEEREVPILISVASKMTEKADDGEEKLASTEKKSGIPFDIPALMLGGFLTVLTPCVLPMIPIILLIAGISSKKTSSKKIIYFISLIAGLMLVYGLLGYFIASLGQTISIFFQNKWFLVGISAFFVLMSLMVSGIIPSPNLTAKIPFMGKSGIFGSFLTGIGVGVMTSPCTAPILASVGGYVAMQASALRGSVLFASYGLGMALSITLLLFLAGSVRQKFSEKMIFWSRKALAVLLLLPALYYTNALVSVSFFDGGIKWTKPAEAFVSAKNSGTPMMIRFTSKTCISCMSVDKLFKDNEVIELSRSMVPVVVDLTVNGDETKEIAKRYGIIGAPAIVFTDSKGEVLDNLKLFNPTKNELISAMKEVLKR